MAEQGQPMTSAGLARCMNTSLVVVRRTMAALRVRDIRCSGRGAGGRWEIACDLEALTLKDIYLALGAPKLPAIGVHLESPPASSSWR